MLCDLCQDLDLDALLSKEGYTHQVDWESLVAAAKKGCELCQLLQKHPYETWTENPKDLEVERSSTEMKDKSSTVSTVFDATPRFRLSKTERVQTGINVVTDFDDPVMTLLKWKGVSKANESQACFDRIKYWVNECTEKHKNCATTNDHPLPTRLIDIGDSASSNPRLVINDKKQNGKWITLSHCWGERMPLTTAKSNIKDHQIGIPISAFPQNFKDAIFLTRRLGYRYIWIDSLCIIQDSKEDWLTESVDMGRIYRESLLTIAADQAESSSHGIFASAIRQGNNWPSYVTTNYHSKLRNMKGRICLRTPTIDSEGTIPSPLSRRAWTLQETTLSPRVLRYSFEELFWSCNEGIFSESAPDIPRDFDRDHKKILQRDQNNSLVSTEEGLLCWYGIMRDYAYRKVTYDTDRLIAISGLSQIVNEITGCTYKAGLWLEDIHHGLLWKTPGDFETVEAYTAPSWSWASVLSIWGDFTKAEIQLYDETLMRAKLLKDGTEAEILEVNVENVAGNLYGQVTAASLRIRGLCRSFEEIEGLDGTSGGSIHHLNVLNYEFDTEVYSFGGGYDDLSGLGVICVQVGRFQTDEGLKIYGLILRPVKKGQGYQRLGSVEIPQDDGISEDWERREICIV